MSSRLVLLGTGTCQLDERRASSVLVELDDLRFVFDLGRGIASRLAEVGLRQDDVRHVVFSHFHPDHISDLIPYLHAAAWSRNDPRTVDLHLHGPRGLEVQIGRLLSLFGPDELTREGWRVHLHEERDNELRLGEKVLAWADLPPAGNHGLRFTHRGITVALTGDSSFHAQEIDFLRDADLAIIDSGHLEDDEIVALATRSRARRIVCSHVYRSLDFEALSDAARRQGYTGRIEAAHDLAVFEL